MGGQRLAGFAGWADAGAADKAEQHQQGQGSLESQGWIVLCGESLKGWTVVGGAKLRAGAIFIQ